MKKRDISERFLENVDKSGGPDACWEWQGSVKPEQAQLPEPTEV
jgi:hypothetical protein